MTITWGDLPTEILHLIISFLDFESEVNSLSQVNSSHYAIINPLLYKRQAESSDEGAIIWAAAHGSEIAVRKMLAAGMSPSPEPLVFASKNGHTTIVKLLLDHGVDPRAHGERKDPFWKPGDYYHDNDDRCYHTYYDPHDKRGDSPSVTRESLKLVGSAVDIAAGYGQAGALRLLLEYIGPDGVTEALLNKAFWAAVPDCHLSAIKVLLDAGCDINNVDEIGMNLLGMMAYASDPSALQYLLERGADVNATGRRGGCPLTFALGFGHAPCVQVLLDHGADIAPLLVKVDDPRREMSTPIDWGYGSLELLRSEKKPLLRMLLEKTSYAQGLIETGSEARLLCLAAFAGRLDLVRDLVARGCDPNQPLRGVDGQTPYRWAVKGGSMEVLRFLLSHISNTDQIYRCDDTQTPLYYAVRGGDADILSRLLECKSEAKEEAVSHMLRWLALDDSAFPLLLDHATDRTWQGPEVVSTVLRMGTATQLQLLLERGLGVKEYISSEGFNSDGALYKVVTGSGDVEARLKLLVQHGFAPQPGFTRDAKLIVDVVFQGYVESLQILIDHGFRLDCGNQSLTRFAASLLDPSVASAMLDLLLRNGVDINDSAHGRETGLMIAIAGGKIAAIRLLMERGANILLGNRTHEFPLCKAACQGHFDIVVLLLEAMQASGYSPRKLRRCVKAAEEALDDRKEKLSREDNDCRRILKALRRVYWRTVYPV